MATDELAGLRAQIDALRAHLAAAQDERDAAWTDHHRVDALGRELERAETELARLPQVEADLRLARRELEIAQARQEELEERLARADAVLAAMQASLSWRITRPLRGARRRGG